MGDLAIRKQMLELERGELEQNSRMELLVVALLRQVGCPPPEPGSQCEGGTSGGQQACSCANVVG